MTREEAREFLINISYKLGNMSVEYLSEKDGVKMREAIEILEQEPRKGHWIPLGNYDDYGIESSYKCSECSGIDTYPDDFCPDCGADMRGEEV